MDPNKDEPEVKPNYSPELHEFLTTIGSRCFVCGEPLIVSIMILTDKGPHFTHFCLSHLLAASEILELLIAGTMSGDLPVQHYKAPQ